MIVIIDNYDSFTYNIVQTIGGFGEQIQVYRNDKVDIETIVSLQPDRLLVSPQEQSVGPQKLGPWKLLKSWSRSGGDHMPGQLAILVSQVIWISV